MDTNRSERRKRVAMIRQVLRFPGMLEEIHLYMWGLGFGQDATPKNRDKLRQLDDKMRQATDYHVRIKRELRDLFEGISPSEDTVQRFNEVYTAFERETASCFEGLLKLQYHLHAPLEIGGTSPAPFSIIYRVIDIDQPKHILKMAAEEIAHCFSVDEEEEAMHGDGAVIEEYIVGDKFENISNSTIVNRSRVEHAFNITEEKLGDEVASAILEIAQYIDQSGNSAAGAVFDQFVKEVGEDKPDKSKLRQYWDGLVAIMPDIVKLAGAGAAIASLF